MPFIILLWCAFCLSSPALAQGSDSHSQLQIKSQLQAVSVDQKTNWAQWRLANQWQAHFKTADLQYWLAQAKTLTADQELQIKSLRFDPRSRSYALGITIQAGWIWDDLELQLSLPQANRLELRLHQNWIPTAWLNYWLAQRLEQKLNKLFVSTPPLQIDFEGEALQFQWLRQKSTLNLGRAELELVAASLTLALDTQGDLRVNFQSQELPAETALLALKADLSGQSFDRVNGQFHLQGQLDLKQLDLDAIPAGESTLANRVQGGAIALELDGKVLAAKTGLPGLEGQLEMQMLNTLIEGEEVPQIRSLPFRWRWQDDDFQIWPLYTPSPAVVPHFSANQLTLFIDGPAYFAEMQQAIRQARESVDQEIFVFYDGETSTQLVRLYLSKALGLMQGTDGQWQADAYAPDGVRVYLLHNHGLTVASTKKVQAMFEREIQRLFADLAQARTLPQSIASYHDRLQRHLQIAPLTRGALKTDHRKLLVIDGKRAYTGGLNLGDHYMQQDAFHDLMVRVEGPLVSSLHQTFIDNFVALRPEQKWTWNIKSPQSLALPAGQATSQVASLLTDDHLTEIEPAILQAIQSAHTQIRLEHAYLYYEPIQQALKQALERGVSLQMIVSERNDESIFEALNLDAIRQLMLAQKYPGQVQARLFQSRGGKNDYMSHTKFMSVDEQVAIVGSANLIPRSLRSPFVSNGQAILFNEELSLLIHDPGFVATLNQEVFAQDWQSRSRAVDLKEVEHLLVERGGFVHLLLAKLQGLLT